MRYVLVVLGLLGNIGASAQRDEHTHNFDQSVFANYRELRPVNAKAMATTQAKVRANFQGWSATVDKLSSNFKDMYGPALNIAGTNAVEKANNCINTKLNDLAVTAGEWQKVSNVSSGKAEYVDYTQTINGHAVVFSSLSFRFTKDGRLTRVKMSSYGKPENGIAPALDKQAVLNTQEPVTHSIPETVVAASIFTQLAVVVTRSVLSGMLFTMSMVMQLLTIFMTGRV